MQRSKPGPKPKSLDSLKHYMLAHSTADNLCEGAHFSKDSSGIPTQLAGHERRCVGFVLAAAPRFGIQRLEYLHAPEYVMG